MEHRAAPGARTSVVAEIVFQNVKSAASVKLVSIEMITESVFQELVA